MIKKSLITLSLILCFCVTYAQPPAVEWSHVYGGSGFESMWAMIPSPGGRYLITGVTSTYGAGGYDFWIMMLNASGNQIWTKTYGTADDEGCTYCIATTDGGFLAVGWRGNGAATDGWLIKLNANGDSTWSRVIGGTQDDIPYWAEQTSDGGYIIAGITRSYGSGEYDGWLVKLDAGGLMQWQRTYGGAGDDEFISVAIASDGGYAMSGYTNSFGAGVYDGWLLKTNASGDSLWSATYGTTGEESLITLSRTADNGYLLVGYADPADTTDAGDWMLVKTNSLGVTQWTKYYGTSGQDAPWQAQQTTDGGYIVGGYFEYQDASGADMIGMKLDANGDSTWTVRFQGDGVDLGWFAYTTPDGGYLFGADTYSSWSAGSADWWVVKTETECNDPTPISPQVVVDPVGSDIHLHWSPVTESVTGCAISATHYLVFYSPTVGGPYYYHGYTSDTTYTHLGVIAYASGQFYHVTASTAPLPTLRALPPAEEQVTEAEVMQMLRSSVRPTPSIQRSPVRHTWPSTFNNQMRPNSRVRRWPSH